MAHGVDRSSLNLVSLEQKGKRISLLIEISYFIKQD